MLTIGAVREYSHGELVDKRTDLDVTEVSDNMLLLKMLDAGRVDIAFCNLNVLSYLHEQSGYDWDLEVLQILTSKPLFIGFSKSIGERGKRLADDFSRELKKIKAGN